MEDSIDKYILIIDDNPMNLLLASKTLENYGIRTKIAESGEAGIQIMETVLPELILLDIMMPEMDGYEVCRKIKKEENWKEIPIIFLTANTHTENLIEGFDAGGVDYITKPFKIEELIVRVKNHMELAQSRKKIIEMNRSRDKVYSIIAHDIRSPLSGILQTVDAIDQGYFDPTSEDFRDIIHHLRIRTKDTITLLSSLLQWTRLQDKQVVLQFQNININDVFSNCKILLEGIALEKNITLNIEIPETLEAWCDEVSINTVFRNLVSNAIKFTNSDGRIHIYGKESNFGVEVTISDNGIGMSQEAINKIFNENQHYTSTGTSNEQGTGLGLMLVKDFLKKNNGSIKVTSELSIGTTFQISLPLKH